MNKILVDHRSFEVHIVIPNELFEPFKKLISRALNTNADCHPAFKEFGDILEHGRVLQDYYSQRSDPFSSRESKSVQELLLEGTRFEILKDPYDPRN